MSTTSAAENRIADHRVPTFRPLFQLERRVNFNCDSFCWTDGPKQLTCHILIITPKLDAEGFVFDNRAIERYFADNFEGKIMKLSCENIAQTILAWFCEQLPDCQRIEIGVSGNPEATMLKAIHQQHTQA